MPIFKTQTNIDIGFELTLQREHGSGYPFASCLFNWNIDGEFIRRVELPPRNKVVAAKGALTRCFPGMFMTKG